MLVFLRWLLNESPLKRQDNAFTEFTKLKSITEQNIPRRETFTSGIKQPTYTVSSVIMSLLINIGQKSEPEHLI